RIQLEIGLTFRLPILPCVSPATTPPIPPNDVVAVGPPHATSSHILAMAALWRHVAWLGRDYDETNSDQRAAARARPLGLWDSDLSRTHQMVEDSLGLGIGSLSAEMRRDCRCDSRGGARTGCASVG